MERFDTWLWAETSTYTRSEKSSNFWKANKFANDKLLFTFRCIVGVAYIYMEWTQYALKKKPFNKVILELTNWAFYTMGIWLVCILYSNYTYGIKGESSPSSSTSPF